MPTVGFIGTGNMGSALARAAAKSARCERLLLADRTWEKAQRLADETGRLGDDDALGAGRGERP